MLYRQWNVLYRDLTQRYTKEITQFPSSDGLDSLKFLNANSFFDNHQNFITIQVYKTNYYTPVPYLVP